MERGVSQETLTKVSQENFTNRFLSQNLHSDKSMNKLTKVALVIVIIAIILSLVYVQLEIQSIHSVLYPASPSTPKPTLPTQTSLSQPTPSPTTTSQPTTIPNQQKNKDISVTSQLLANRQYGADYDVFEVNITNISTSAITITEAFFANTPSNLNVNLESGYGVSTTLLTNQTIIFSSIGLPPSNYITIYYQMNDENLAFNYVI